MYIYDFATQRDWHYNELIPLGTSLYFVEHEGDHNGGTAPAGCASAEYVAVDVEKNIVTLRDHRTGLACLIQKKPDELFRTADEALIEAANQLRRVTSATKSRLARLEEFARRIDNTRAATAAS